MTSEQATFLAQQFVHSMKSEVPATLKVLAAVNDEQRSYRPDDRSRTAWELATHLATADVGFLESILTGAFTYDGERTKSLIGSFGSGADVVRFYEREFGPRLDRIAALPAEDLLRVIDFYGMIQQRAVQYLTFANNHSVHHRGQLAAYLRAMGSKVPAIYGDSADEVITR